MECNMSSNVYFAKPINFYPLFEAVGKSNNEKNSTSSKLDELKKIFSKFKLEPKHDKELLSLAKEYVQAKAQLDYLYPSTSQALSEVLKKIDSFVKQLTPLR